MGDIKIRQATVDDIDALYELIKLFEPESRVAKEFMTRNLANENEIVCVAYCGNEMTGFICGQTFTTIGWHDPVGRLEGIYVREQYRRAGVAAALMEYLEREFAARGITHLHLCVADDNSASRALCEKFSYRIDGIEYVKDTK